MSCGKRSPLFWALLVLGILCALALLLRRDLAEVRNRETASAVFYRDLSELAGEDPALWLLSVDADYLICSDGDEAPARALAERCGMGLGRAGDAARPGDAFLLPPWDAAEGFSAWSASPSAEGTPLALVEDLSRTGLLAPPDYDPETCGGTVVKTLYLYDSYAVRREADGETPEAENILFRAALERSARLLVLRPLRGVSGEAITEPEVYRAMLERLGGRLGARGLRMEGAFSRMEAPALNRWLLAGCALAAAALLAELLFALAPALRRRWGTLLPAALAVLAAAASLALPALSQKLLAFGGAVLGGCWAGLCLDRLAERELAGARWAPVPAYLRSLALLLGISLAGGLYVAAVLSSRAYLLGAAVFSGVKLAELLPLAFAGVLGLRRLLRALRTERARVTPLQWGLAALCLLALAAALLLRSGDNASLVSGLELRGRDWLEHVCYARPRSKEFLLAIPALALFLLACRHRAPLLALPLSVASALEAVSVINSFCHGFTPLDVSVLRTLLGALFGVIPGLALLGLSALPRGKKRTPLP